MNDDLWDGWVMMMRWVRRRNRPETRLLYVNTFLFLIFPSRLLDFRVFRNLCHLLLVLGVVQEAEDVLPGFAEFVFEHDGDMSPVTIWPGLSPVDGERCGP